MFYFPTTVPLLFHQNHCDRPSGQGGSAEKPWLPSSHWWQSRGTCTFESDSGNVAIGVLEMVGTTRSNNHIYIYRCEITE